MYVEIVLAFYFLYFVSVHTLRNGNGLQDYLLRMNLLQRKIVVQDE